MDDKHYGDGHVGSDDEGAQLGDGGKAAGCGGLDHQGENTVRGQLKDHLYQAADDGL